MELRSPSLQSTPPSSGRKGNLIRVVVIDDHPVIGEALSRALASQEDMVCCGIADSGEAGMAIIKETRPDVVILDISLGDVHGLSLLGQIRVESPGTRVVVYSMTAEAAYAERAIRAGALGYVAKSEASGTVMEAVRTAHQGRVYLNSHIAARMLNKIVHGNDVRRRTGLDRLTGQEMYVFQMLGHAYSIEEIADRMGVSRKTAVAYRCRAKTKLGLPTVGKLVQHAMECSQGLGEVEQAQEINA